MMKHVLIPTDFSIQSLNAVHAAMATYNGKIKITLFHLLRTQGDISDMLFPSMRNRHLKLVTANFKEACEILQNRYDSSLVALNIKFGFGNTIAYLQNLLEGEKIDEILLCPDIKLSLPGNESIEMATLLQRTGYKITSVSSKNKNSILNTQPLTLTGNEMKIPKEIKEYAAEK